MSANLTLHKSIAIDATVEQVWEALTDPELIKEYFFDTDTTTDWKKGSPLLWQAPYEGKEMVFVKGTIVDIRPGRFLAYTTIDPNSAIEDKDS